MPHPPPPRTRPYYWPRSRFAHRCPFFAEDLNFILSAATAFADITEVLNLAKASNRCVAGNRGVYMLVALRLKKAGNRGVGHGL